MELRLIKKVFFKGTIEAKTGVSVGGSSTGLEIGGADKVVVRNPLTSQPYIPGSSLKGKMRSLLEKLYEKFHPGTDEKGNPTAKPCICGVCLICKVFGVSAEEKGMPARLIVRDAELTKDSAEQLENSKSTDMPFTEVKTEVVIDRITSAATPRSFERVPAGAEFELNLVCNIYENDDEKEILGKVFEGLRIVQDDYLGGSGSRGYGQVSFGIDSLT
ncbi:MAG: type III-A CRISPR-associated RAMP protein Csm3 [Desulfobacteraceae bacterium 4572_88]|nr:MAG: type III-A CRISPR-associated RAMP protein Csm3 [Desulfobacteraceae bacterium 4572_88]